MDKRTKIKVLTTPDVNENQYVDNVARILRSIAKVELTVVDNINFNLIKHGYHTYDVAVIHWLENIVVSKAKRVSFRGTIKFFLKFLIIKFVSKKTIYVRHNIYPHALTGLSALVAKSLTSICMSLSDHRVVHSGHLANKHTTYIPHPLYSVEPANFSSKRRGYYIVFGRIAEYKAIDTLLSHWGTQLLLVAGKVDSQNYLSKLEEIVEKRSAKNIEIAAKFLSDDLAATYVLNSKGLIITHHDRDMIVSGSFFFAISLGVPVYAIETPFFKWLKNEYNFYGLTLYSDIESLVNSVNSSLECSFNSERIKQAAISHFGDGKIKKYWEPLIQL